MKLEIETKEPTAEKVITGLHQTWIEGKEEDGSLEFLLTCGAGLGSPHCKLFVKMADGTEYYDHFDVRDLIPQWIEKLQGASE